LFAYIFFLFLVRKKVFLLSLPQFHAFLSSSFEDLLLWVFVGVLLGGRLGHVFIYDFSYYFLHPLKIFAFRE
jgi:prolipoprotein diacylglyceryltransferase